MKVGLFFGSFNPVHVGHMVIASYMAEYTDLEQVWFVVSPHNPLKQKESLLDDQHRLQLVRLATEDNRKLKASNIEFGLPQPNYTVNTLSYLYDMHPDHRFVLMMGADNLTTFKKWKNWEQILEMVEVYVYPRRESDGGDLLHHPKVKVVNAPIMEISATFIREAIRNNKDVRYMLPDVVWKYMKEMHFYEK
ncbi:MAG: nicotinate (nicotinamide) nucleotide adenylyltransferase [Bacteroidota bacterium]